MTTGVSGVWGELERAMADLRVAHAELELTSQEKLHLCATRMAEKYRVIEPPPRPRPDYLIELEQLADELEARYPEVEPRRPTLTLIRGGAS